MATRGKTRILAAAAAKTKAAEEKQAAEKRVAYLAECDRIFKENQAKTAVVKVAVEQATKPLDNPKRNEVVLVLDASSSIKDVPGLTDKMIRFANGVLSTLKENAVRENIPTFISVVLFSYYHKIDVIRRNQNAELIPPLRSDEYQPFGMTALYDAVGVAINVAKSSVYAKNLNTSFVIQVVTDGQENNSVVHNIRQNKHHELLQRMGNLTKGDGRWSFVFSVPDANSKRELVTHGVPGDNIEVWEVSARGMEETLSKTNAAYNKFYTERSTIGSKSSKEFFTTNLSKLTQTEAMTKLTDLTSTLKGWPIEREVALQEFLNYHGYKNVVGASYYLLMKPEKLRIGRKVIISPKGTKVFYGGNNARSLLGIPEGETLVTPGNHGDWDVYFQSTSRNRILVRGTRLLYDLQKTVDDAETWDSAGAKAAADAKKAAQGVTT